MNPIMKVAVIPPLRRLRLWGEALVLYGCLPLGIWRYGRGRPVLPVLWIATLLALGLLRAQPGGWARLRAMLHWQGGVQTLQRLLIRGLGVGVCLALPLALWRPDLLFAFPRQQPRIWLMVVLFYPLISVFPQGIVYRALFYTRYAILGRRPLVVRLAAATAFCLAHLVFNNVWALLLTFAGGWLFAATFERTRSLTVSCLEHALYGNLVFTIGWGPVLYHGTQAVVERL